MRASRSGTIVAATSPPVPAARSSAASAVSGSAASSATVRPANVTASASARSPAPWHSGHGVTSTWLSARRRSVALAVLASVCST